MRAMRFRWALLPFWLGLPVTCDNPEPSLLGVDPAQGTSDSDLRLVLTGRDFIPATILDPQTGRRIATSDGFSARVGANDRWARLTALTWLSAESLAALLPANAAVGLPVGALDVVVTDPRGREAVLAGGFVELGPDLAPPLVSFTSPAPGTEVAPGSRVRGSFRVRETPPASLRAVAWRVYEQTDERDHGRCWPPPGATEIDCSFDFTTSDSLVPGDSLWVLAEATDASPTGNVAQAVLPLGVRARSRLDAISPDRGGTAGGTDIVIFGSGFRADSQATIGGELIFPNGGVVIDENTISGHTPPHAAGPATVTVSSPSEADPRPLVFTYLAPPQITGISPASGPADGGTAVSITGTDLGDDTRIYFGASLVGAAPLVDAFRQSDTAIVGRAPAGSGLTTVWASSDLRGFTALVGCYTWRAP